MRETIDLTAEDGTAARIALDGVDLDLTEDSEAGVFQRFLDGVRGGGALSPGLDEGWRTAELAEAIERSWKERRPIDLPLTLDPDPEKHP